jgi:hypothetical protein
MKVGDRVQIPVQRLAPDPEGWRDGKTVCRHDSLVGIVRSVCNGNVLVYLETGELRWYAGKYVSRCQLANGIRREP